MKNMKVFIMAFLMAGMMFAEAGCGKQTVNTIDMSSAETTAPNINAYKENMDYRLKETTLETYPKTEVSEEDGSNDEKSDETKSDNNTSGSSDKKGSGGKKDEKKPENKIETLPLNMLFDNHGDLDIKSIVGMDNTVGNEVDLTVFKIVQKTEKERLVASSVMLRNTSAKRMLDKNNLKLYGTDEDNIYSTYTGNAVVFGRKDVIGELSPAIINPLYFAGRAVKLNNLENQKDDPDCLLYIETTLKNDTSLYLEPDIDKCFVKGVYCNAYDENADSRVYFYNDLHVGMPKKEVETNVLNNLNCVQTAGLVIYKNDLITLCIKYDSTDTVSDIILLDNKIDYSANL